MKIKNQISFLFYLIMLFSNYTSLNCWAYSSIKKNDHEETPIEDYYRAMHKYATSSATVALEMFEQIDRNYPILPFSQEIAVMIIYLQYLDRSYDHAIQSIDRFLEMHPRTPYESYLSYMRALCSYRQITGINKSYEMKLRTKNEMDSLAKKFPDTQYGKKAKEFSKYLETLLIYNDFTVGQFYQKDRSYIAAIGRYRDVISSELGKVKNITPLAYYKLAECYNSLGIFELEEKYKQLFNEEIKKLNGSVSFEIEGIIRYQSPESIEAAKTEKLKKNLRKVASQEIKHSAKIRREEKKMNKQNKKIKKK